MEYGEGMLCNILLGRLYLEVPVWSFGSKLGVARSWSQDWIYGSFRKLGVPYYGVIIRILLFRVITILGSPIFGNSHMNPKKELLWGLWVNP